jgi:RpiR family murPQ operon transcriptional repressor
MGLLMKMMRIKDLTPAERQVTEYVINHMDEMGNIGIVELGEKSFSSPTTIKRLCSKLGIESYIDFRVQISQEVENYNKISILKKARNPVRKHDSLSQIIEKVSYRSAKSILDSKELNKEETFVKVIDLMKKAKQIDFYGIGPSHIVAQDAQIKALRLGFATTCFDNHIEMLINARMSKNDRLGILISYTGETQDIINVAQELKVQKVPAVSITSYSNNSVSQLCDTNIFVDASESFNRLGGMSSRIATLNVIDVLFTALINSDYDAYADLLKKSFLGSGHNQNSK